MNARFHAPRERAPISPRRALRHALAAFLTCFAGTALADADAPWVVDGTTYLPDPGYNDGLYSADAFAGSEGFNYRSRAIVALDDGSVIVAALVPAASGGDGTPLNVGLIHYDAEAHRVAFANPGAYGVFGNQYVVYPNTSDANTPDSAIDIKAMRRLGDRLFVLIDHPFAGTADIDSKLLMFNVDGSFISSTSLASTTFPETGGGIVVSSNLQFPETITLAWDGTTTVTDGTLRPTFRAFTVNDDGTLDPQTDLIYPIAGNLCDSLHDCELHGIAAGGVATQAPSRYYLVGGRQYEGDDWDFLIYALKPNGDPVTDFSTDGARTVDIDVGGTMHDVANTVSVSRTIGGNDTIYLAGTAAQGCEPGVGIVELLGSGMPGAFGVDGIAVVGGSNEADTATCSIGFVNGSARADTAYASAIDGGKLGIAGINVYGPGVFCPVGGPCREDNVDGELIVIDTATGSLDSFLGYAFSDVPGGARTRHSGFAALTGSGVGTGVFTAAGDARFFQAAPGDPPGAMQAATLRLRAGGGDQIFADGFDG
jgi:hypothetical protein